MTVVNAGDLQPGRHPDPVDEAEDGPDPIEPGRDQSTDCTEVNRGNYSVVQVRVETCEELRAGVGGTAGAALAMPQGQYGFTDKVPLTTL